MIKSINTMLAIAVVAAAATFTPLTALAAEGEGASTEAEITKPAKVTRFPFRGRIIKVDQKAKTISLAGREKDRIIHINEETKITKDGKPAELLAAMVGDEVGGLALRSPDGKDTAVSLRVGPKPGAATAVTEAKAAEASEE